MLGYVRPVAAELKVRENELYRAVYCGLCRSMGRCTGCASRLTLSYDFVFLALVRYALSDTEPTLARGRCAVHPCRARYYAKNDATLTYCAAAAALLMRGKICDDAADERGVKRLRATALVPVANGIAARAAKCEGDVFVLSDCISRELDRLSELETAKSDDIDAAADTFGRIMAQVLSNGIVDEKSARIAREIGKYTGRFVYICDAADDIGEDARLGRANPFLFAYGTDVLERRECGDLRGGTKERLVLPRDIAESVLVAAKLDLHRLWDAYALVSGGERVSGIIENVISLGMTSAVMQALGLVPPGGGDNF